MKVDGKKIKVGYSVIDIKTQSPDFKKENMADTYGQYISRENRIEIQEGLSDIDEANALLHEVFHACCWVSSLNQDGQPLEDTNIEEVVVNSFANVFTQVVMDNDWLLEYLKKLKK
jgi:hypothetical protein